MQICSGAWESLFYPVTEALGGEDTTRWVSVIVHQPGRQGLTTQVQYQGLHHHVVCCLDSLAAIQICSRSIHQRKLRALLLDMKVLMASGNGNGLWLWRAFETACSRRHEEDESYWSRSQCLSVACNEQK